MGNFHPPLTQDVGTGVVASDGAGPQFAKKDCGANPTHRGCKEEPPTYTVELGPLGDISGGPKESIPGVPEVENFEADLSFFKDNPLVTCGGEDLPTSIEGYLVILGGRTVCSSFSPSSTTPQAT